MEKINVGIIGFGLSGKAFHAPIIGSLPEYNIKKIYTKKLSSKSFIQENYKETEVVDDVLSIIGDKNIDLIIVTSPNIFHFSQAKMSLQNGKHVVVEKPFTITSEEGDKLINISEENGKILSVFQNRRWDSDFKTVKNIINNNFLGNIVEYEAHFDRFRPDIKENSWRDKSDEGSGMLYDLGSHLIDQAVTLFGLPKEIFAELSIEREGGECIDSFIIILKYEDKRAILKSSSLVKEKGPHFIVHGRKGSFIKYGMDVQEDRLVQGYTPTNDDNWGKEDEENYGYLNTEINNVNFKGNIESEKGDYREYYKNVYRAINGIEELYVKGEEGRNVIRIIELAMESSINKKWVNWSK